MSTDVTMARERVAVEVMRALVAADPGAPPAALAEAAVSFADALLAAMERPRGEGES